MSFISFPCHTKILTIFFVWKVLLYLNESLTPAQDMMCHQATGIFSCYSQSNWTKQQDRQLSESWDFQTVTEGCYQCIQIPDQNPWRISHYLHMAIFIVQSITYLPINLIFFSFTCVSYSRLWTLQKAKTEVLQFYPHSSVQISTITLYNTYRAMSDPAKLQAKSTF